MDNTKNRTVSKKISLIIKKIISNLHKNKKNTILFFVVIFLWLSFENTLFSLFNKYIIPYIDIEVNQATLIIFSIIIIFCLFWIYPTWKYKYYIPYKIILSLIFGLFIYVGYRVSYSSSYVIYGFDNCGYLDVIFLIILIYTVLFIINHIRLYKTSIPEIDERDILKREKAIEELRDDNLNYEIDARKFIEEIIKKVDKEDSFSIGIVSEWGVGKTSFINIIMKCLCDDSAYIVVNFNPSLSKNKEQIQPDFFETLRHALKSYSSIFSNLFFRYMSSIDIISNKTIIQIIKEYHSDWNKKLEKKKINDAIRAMKRRIIIIIDDLDRLDIESIKEVLKIIYHNASFTNVIFITAFSKEIIDKKLKGETGVNYYSDKYFDLEYLIPPRNYTDYYNTLIECLNLNFSDKLVEYSQNEILSSFDTILKFNLLLIKRYLPTYRDIKRFYSSFKISYSQVKDGVDFIDYFFLHILFYKNKNLYTEIFNGKHLISRGNVFILSKEYNGDYKDILEILFSETENKANKFYRTINKAAFFDYYFSEQLIRNLKINELERLFTLNEEKDAFTKINEWNSNRKFNDVSDFLIFLNKNKYIKSKKDLKRYVKLLYFQFTQTNQKNLIIPHFISKYPVDILDKVNMNTNDYKKFIEDILILKDSDSFPIYSSLIKELILDYHRSINNNKQYECILSLDELLDININLFEGYIKEVPIMTLNHMELLYGCITGIDNKTNIVSLNENCCSIMKEAIIEYPNNYIANFVRLGGYSSAPDFNTVSREPFYEKIFGSNKEFESFIYNSDLDDLPAIPRVRNFWEIYKQNKYMPIEFENDGDVQEKINNDLINEKDRLDKLKKIHQDYFGKEGLKEKSQSYINEDVSTINNYIMNLQSLEMAIDKINLYIELTASIKRAIHERILQLQEYLKHK